MDMETSYIPFMYRYRNLVLSRSINHDGTNDEKRSYIRFNSAQDVLAVQRALNNPLRGKIGDLFSREVEIILDDLHIGNFDRMVELYKDSQRLPALIELANSTIDAIAGGLTPSDIIGMISSMLPKEKLAAV
jgi:hypothetical protein